MADFIYLFKELPFTTTKFDFNHDKSSNIYNVTRSDEYDMSTKVFCFYISPIENEPIITFDVVTERLNNNRVVFDDVENIDTITLNNHDFVDDIDEYIKKGIIDAQYVILNRTYNKLIIVSVKRSPCESIQFYIDMSCNYFEFKHTIPTSEGELRSIIKNRFGNDDTRYYVNDDYGYNFYELHVTSFPTCVEKFIK